MYCLVRGGCLRAVLCIYYSYAVILMLGNLKVLGMKSMCPESPLLSSAV